MKFFSMQWIGQDSYFFGIVSSSHSPEAEDSAIGPVF
jgi:hypothetical protein